MYLPWQAVSAGGSYQRFGTDPNLKRAFKDVAALLLRRPRAYWNHPQTGERLLSCAIITTAAIGSLAQGHERMPVVLPEHSYASWLDRKLTDHAKVSFNRRSARSAERVHARQGPALGEQRQGGKTGANGAFGNSYRVSIRFCTMPRGRY